MTANNSARANGRRRRVSPNAATPDAAKVTAAKAALEAVLSGDNGKASAATSDSADDLEEALPESPGSDSVEGPATPAVEAADLPRTVAKFVPKTTTHSEEKTMSGEVIDVSPKPAKGRTKKAEIQLHQPMGSVLNRPVMPSDLEVVGMMTVAGDRPVVASHLELFGSFLNGRPIEASHEKIFEMLGDRPVFESAIKMVDDGGMAGGRPIMASNPDLLEASLLPGGRPIASNDIDDATTLMGYLD
jgi:hypothetical protein